MTHHDITVDEQAAVRLTDVHVTCDVQVFRLTGSSVVPITDCAVVMRVMLPSGDGDPPMA